MGGWLTETNFIHCHDDESIFLTSLNAGGQVELSRVGVIDLNEVYKVSEVSINTQLLGPSNLVTSQSTAPVVCRCCPLEGNLSFGRCQVDWCTRLIRHYRSINSQRFWRNNTTTNSVIGYNSEFVSSTCCEPLNLKLLIRCLTCYDES